MSSIGRRERIEQIFEEIMIEKYPELIKHFKAQTEEIKRTLSRTFFITTHNKEADIVMSTQEKKEITQQVTHLLKIYQSKYQNFLPF